MLKQIGLNNLAAQLTKIAGPTLAVILMSTQITFAQSTVTAESQSADRAQCARSILLATNESGKITDIQFETRDQATQGREAEKLVVALAEKLQAHPFSNTTVLYTEYFLDFSEQVSDMVRGVTKTFSILGQGKGSDVIEKSNTLLYGAASLNEKIQALDATITKQALFKKEARVEKIKALADEIRQCRGVIAACKVKLPNILKTANSEHEMLKKAKLIVTQEIDLLQKTKALLDQYLSPEEANKVSLIIDKKLVELQSGSLTLNLLIEETDKLVQAVAKVVGDIDQINEGVFQRAVIKAAKENIDLRKTLMDPTQSRRENLSSEINAKPGAEMESIKKIAAETNLSSSERLEAILPLVENAERLTQGEFISLSNLLLDEALFSSKIFSPVTNHDLSAEFANQVIQTVQYKYQKQLGEFFIGRLGLKTLILGLALSKVRRGDGTTEADWYQHIELLTGGKKFNGTLYSEGRNIEGLFVNSFFTVPNAWGLVCSFFETLSHRIYEEQS